MFALINTTFVCGEKGRSSDCTNNMCVWKWETKNLQSLILYVYMVMGELLALMNRLNVFTHFNRFNADFLTTVGNNR